MISEEDVEPPETPTPFQVPATVFSPAVSSTEGSIATAAAASHSSDPPARSEPPEPPWLAFTEPPPAAASTGSAFVIQAQVPTAHERGTTAAKRAKTAPARAAAPPDPTEPAAQISSASAATFKVAESKEPTDITEAASQNASGRMAFPEEPVQEGNALCSCENESSQNMPKAPLTGLMTPDNYLLTSKVVAMILMPSIDNADIRYCLQWELSMRDCHNAGAAKEQESCDLEGQPFTASDLDSKATSLLLIAF